MEMMKVPVAVKEPEAEAGEKKKWSRRCFHPEEQHDGRQLRTERSTSRIPIRSCSMAPEPRRKWPIFQMQPWRMSEHRILGEVGDLIAQVVGELRDFDAAEEE